MSIELELWRFLGSPSDLPAAFMAASERLREELGHRLLCLDGSEDVEAGKFFVERG